MGNESVELALRLFWAGVAMTILVASIKPERWIRVIFIFLGLTCGALAIFWPDVSPYFPRFAQALQRIVANPWAWFILLMVALLLSNITSELKSFRTRDTSNKEAIPTGDQDQLTIHYAGYGSERGKYHDVTANVINLIYNGNIHAYVTNDLFGDTDPGRRKEIFIVYSHGEIEGEWKTIPEQRLIVLP